MGGEEINTSPTHLTSTIDMSINFGDLCSGALPRLAGAPDLMTHSRGESQGPDRFRAGKPGRLQPRTLVAIRTAKQPALIAANVRLEATPGFWLISRVGEHAAFAFLPTGMVFAERLVVFPFNTYAAFCTLQSRPHEIWARFFGSSLEDRFMYAAVDCFETFPFPENWVSHPALEPAGKAYYEFRAALMVRNNEGLTKTYNRFHNPDERAPDILKLREMHAAMDRAVLDAYGWSDISVDCAFLLDYDIDEEEWGNKKKPYRYRWPDEVHDEVLARLLEFNAERAKEETRSGAAAWKKRSRKKAAERVPAEQETEKLF